MISCREIGEARREPSRDMQSLGLGEVSLTKNVIMSGDSAERTRILFTVLKATRVEYVTNMTIWDDFVGE